jgi:hypothetical protein
LNRVIGYTDHDELTADSKTSHEVSHRRAGRKLAAVGVARATKGNVTPAGEKFCEVLRQTSIQLPAFLEERITYENHVHGAS